MVLYYCVKCGTLVEHTAMVCPNCGKNIFKKVRNPNKKRTIEAK